MWCLPLQQPGQCPAAGDPFPPGAAASRSAPLPGEAAGGVLARTPQGERPPQTEPAVPSPRPVAAARARDHWLPRQVSAGPFPSGAPARRQLRRAPGEQLCDTLRGWAGWRGAERLEKCWWRGRGVSPRLLLRGHVVRL